MCRIGVVEQILGMWTYCLNLSLHTVLFETRFLVIAVWFAFCACDVLNARKLWEAHMPSSCIFLLLHVAFGVGV